MSEIILRGRYIVLFRLAAIILTLTSLPFVLPGQSNDRIDSLQRQLDIVHSDSVKIELLVELSKAYQYLDNDKAKLLADEAVVLADEKDLSRAKLIVYKQQRYLCALRGDFTNALKYDKMRLAVAMASNDSAHTACTLNFIGSDYIAVGEYDEAYHYFTQSYKISNAIKDTARFAIALRNVSAIFKELGQFNIALNYLFLSKKMSEKVKDLNGPAYTYKEIGDIFLRKNEYDSANIALMKSLVLVRKRNIGLLEPEVIVKLARLYLNKNQFDVSFAFYDTATTLYDKAQNIFGIAETQLGKGRVLLNQGNYNEARNLILKALTTSKKLNARNLEIKCNRSLAILYEKIDEFKDALKYTKQVNILKDSLFSQDMVEKIFQDQLRFEMKNKDLVITALSKTRAGQTTEIKKQSLLRNILIVVITLALILLFIVYRSDRNRIKINTMLVANQDKLKKRNVELEQFNQVKDKFLSVISHDLRSPINALSGILDLLSNNNITLDELTKLTQELKLQFNYTNNLINNLLEWALIQMDNLNIQKIEVNLKKMVDDNFKLLTSIYLKKVNLINEISNQHTVMADANMINLVLRNLITNGLKFTESGGSVKVSARTEGEQVVISVSDNGVGINPKVRKILFEKTSSYTTRGTANEKGTGLGLILCKEFIESNGGKIWFESQEGNGSTFYFTVSKA